MVILILFCSGRGSAKIIDMVVASVDQEAILYSEVLLSIQPEMIRLQQETASNAEYEKAIGKLVEDTLDEAIESKILYREALKFSIVVPDERVEAQIDHVRKLYDTNDEFMKALMETGETLSDFRDRTRKRIMSQSVEVSKMNTLEDEIVVDEVSLLQYYEDNKDHYQKPERVRVRQIMLRVRRDPDLRSKARARLEMVREELQAGASFDDLAIAHSQGPAAPNGGLVGWTSKGDLVVELEQAIFGLSEGEISQVVDSQFGVHLLFAEQKEEAGIAPLDEVRASIEPILKSNAALIKYEIWLQDLRKRSRVRIFL